MTAAAERDEARAGPVSDRALWLGVLTGPVVWAARFTASYALVETACATGWWWLLPALSAAGVAVTAAAGYASWRALRRVGRAGDDPVAERRRFMALAGVASSALFVAATVAESLPLLWIGPCL